MFILSQVCDIKEDVYFCPEHALQYLQERKMGQRRNCKLYYTHSKEEISAIIKNVNQRLDDSDEEDSSSEDEMTRPPCKRISEMSTMQWSQRPKDNLLPLHGHLELKHSSTPHRLPTASSTRCQQQSPTSESTSPTSSTSRLSGPKVPPGTAINVSSFSLIQYAKGKKLAAAQEKSTKDKKSPESSKKVNKTSPIAATASKKSNKKESKTSPKENKTDKKSAVEKGGKTNKNKKVSSPKVENKKDNRAAKTKASKQNVAKKRKNTDPDSDGQGSGSALSEEDSAEEEESTDESSASPPLKKTRKTQKPQKSQKPSPSKKQKKEAPTASEKRRTSRRTTKKRKASLGRSGNLASEILDMLLSTSNDESEEDGRGEDSSDESWK